MLYGYRKPLKSYLVKSKLNQHFGRTTLRLNMKGFTCSKCGKYHDDMPMCFGADYPDCYWSIPPQERADRVEMNQDLCVVDGEHFFIRARIEIPVIDNEEPFCWNVWTTLSEANFVRANAVWNDPQRIKEPPYFGWLQTALPGYLTTLNIKTLVHTQAVGTIPLVEVIEENHPLTIDQQKGITIQRVIEMVEMILHPE